MVAITVSQLNTYIKQIFDAEEFLHNISVEGEIFGVSSARNVIYFSLKDENSTLSCVCFYPNFIGDIIEGEKVIVTGSPNYYVKGGKLNFNVVRIEKVGQGQLYEQFLKLKKQLEDEGLFAQQHKKTLPKEIKRIGVITSKEGAVIQDIKNVTWRRNPTIDIVLYNTKVQGKQAENEIAHAIEVMGNYDKIDVIIVARGGGSLEDLWAYNSEIVARATYNCPKPIISAVGHETDFTIIDFVSDLRAPTPSAAAELLTYNLNDKKMEMYGLFESFVKTCSNYTRSNQMKIEQICNNFAYNVERFLINKQNKITQIKTYFLNNSINFINQKYYDMGILENNLKNNNPSVIFNKGYVKIEQHQKTIKTKSEVDFNEELSILFKDGVVQAKPKIKENNNEN